MTDAKIPPAVLRSALLDPWVRKEEVVGRVAGRRVDAEDLHRVLAQRLPGRTVTAEDLDDALRAVGGRGIGPGRLSRAIARRLGREPTWPALYWFPATAWWTATRSGR